MEEFETEFFENPNELQIMMLNSRKSQQGFKTKLNKKISRKKID